MPSLSPFRLVSDLDGVLAHSQPAIIEVCNARCGTQYRYEDWKYYEFISDEAMRLTGQTAPEVATWLYGAEVMIQALPTPGALLAVKDLVSAGGSVSVVTSRSPVQRVETQNWLKNAYHGLLSIDVRLPEEIGESGVAYKVRKAEELSATHYIDDDPAVLALVAARKDAGGFDNLCQLFLVDQPWNQSAPLPLGAVRVGNWKQNDYGWDDIQKMVY